MRALGLWWACLAMGGGMWAPPSHLSGQGEYPRPPDPSAFVYQAPWASNPIRVDGSLTDPDWASAPWSEDFVDIRGPSFQRPPFRTRVKILWDSLHLYVGAEIQEPDLWATLSERDDIIYRDDDFEIFLDHDGDGENYFEFEINALGTVLDLFLPKPYRRGGEAHLEWNATGLKSAVRLEGTLNDPSDQDQGWWVEMAIPWEDLVPPGLTRRASDEFPESGPGAPFGTAPEPGTEWRVNFSRVNWPFLVVWQEGTKTSSYRKSQRPGPEDGHPEANWVWSPQGAIDMHLPEMWGTLRFLEPQGKGGIR